MDPFGAKAKVELGGEEAQIARLGALQEARLVELRRLPYSLRVLLENVLRHVPNGPSVEDDVLAVAAWDPVASTRPEIPLMPARVLLQDFTGVPCVVDLAAMRSAVAALGGDPALVNPVVPVDLVIDHSVQVDFAGSPDACRRNMDLEMQRNGERYSLLRWAQQEFEGLRVVPPGMGIVHQVNLEFLASVVDRRELRGEVWAFPDSVVGTDSHTTMINGLGVLGWGVGGIEAEAVMLGRPYYMLLPDVVGVRLAGRLAEDITATDLVLTITELLRKAGVVGRFVEYFGPGVTGLTLPDRATVANMAPEYGATMGFFPVDGETLRYLRLTGRPRELVDRVHEYCRLQSLLREDPAEEPEYTRVIELDLAEVRPSIAGPRRPQDRLALAAVPARFEQELAAVKPGDGRGDGAVVIAAITSCTNTSNPSVMIGAGLLARNAVARGLSVPPWVKTSLAPGSRVVAAYLEKAGLLEPLEALGFHVVGYGCTSCIGNSGPLSPVVESAIDEDDLVVAAVLSGNRNFEARVHPRVRANFLASPLLVVAYAVAGTAKLDLVFEPLGRDEKGEPVYLRDLWPSAADVASAAETALDSDLFQIVYQDVFSGDERWATVATPRGSLYSWDPNSTYVQEPPFLSDFRRRPAAPHPLDGARILAILGDSVTTDHISPAGSISHEGPAGRYLLERGVEPADFNSYGARRGNHEVMMRGTFANVRIRNLMLDGREGGWTKHHPSGDVVSIYEAAERYTREGVPLVVVAGEEYGTGSSRDWAAKGPALLGVRAVIAKSYERIHRSNLVGMGILPLQFFPGEDAAGLGLTGAEILSVEGLDQEFGPGARLQVRVTQPAEAGARPQEARSFAVTVRLDSPEDVEYYREGGILPRVLRLMLAEAGV